MRYKAISALALLGVLISGGSVGSQDPLRARAEAESAESAIALTASHRVFDDFRPDHPTKPSTFALATTRQPSSVAERVEVAPTAPINSDVADLPALIDPALNDEASSFAVAERRLRATVPDDIEPYFDLFMYVSKANRGPLAQRMYVFQRDADGTIIPYAEWRVSTGREKVELHHERKVRTITPEGIFALNPKRFHKRYWSTSWDGAPMHYAMFYDMLQNGNQSGLAVHAAVGRDKIRRLGKRDSAGCIRLAPKNAKELFYKVRNTTQGLVPILAVNTRGSTDRWGRAERDEGGAIRLQDGYRALVFVENYDGRDELISPVIAYTQ